MPSTIQVPAPRRRMSSWYSARGFGASGDAPIKEQKLNTQKKSSRLGLLSLALGLVAWSPASYPANSGDAYWQDKRWDSKLLDAMQSALHYPTDTAGQPVQPVPETAQVTIGFIYTDGKISDPQIIKSSGRPDLDTAFLSQVMTAQLPKASGNHAAEPHQFKQVLKMRTPMQD